MVSNNRSARNCRLLTGEGCVMRIPSLILSKVTVTLQAETDANLPMFLGSTLRGALASAVKKVACALRVQSCTDCLLIERCPYALLFETAPDSELNLWQNRDNWPRPIVIEPPAYRQNPYKKHELLTFGITLVGKAVDHFPYLLYGLNSMAQFGLGRDRYRFKLVEVVDEAPASEKVSGGEKASTGGNAPTGEKALTAEAPKVSKVKLFQADVSPTRFTTPLTFDPLSVSNNQGRAFKSVTLDFVTPARIMENGRLTQDLPFPILVKALAGRVSSLAAFHCGAKEPWDYEAFIEAAPAVRVRDSSLKFSALSRWSNRQQQSLSISGIEGSVTYVGTALPMFLDLLRLGEFIHIGKSSVLGLGRYTLTTNGRL